MDIEEALRIFEEGKTLIALAEEENYPIKKGEIGRVLEITERYGWVDIGEMMEIYEERGEPCPEPPQPPYYLIKVKWDCFMKDSTYNENVLLSGRIVLTTPSSYQDLQTRQLSLTLQH